MNDEEEFLLTDDKDREQIRKDLAHTSFKDLQKLKDKLGIKVYKEVLFGEKNKKKIKFKQHDKNAPPEMSAKIRVPMSKQVIKTKKVIPRDPRFDSLCGTFDKKAFKHSYAFINKLRENDLKTLKKELKNAMDPKNIKKIKYLIQRLENQLTEDKRFKKKEEKKQQEKKELLETIKRGEKPVFKKKSEKKVLNLISQYEELKDTGKLKKHVQRLQKKNNRKNRAKLRTDETE